MKIGVLGLGLIGSAVARRLHQQDHEVIGWNRRSEPAQALAAEGIAVADSVEQAIRETEIVILLLSDAGAIGEALSCVLSGESLTGRTLIQMGTIAPDESRAIASQVEAAGGTYLEAPVLGSLPEARDGRLLIMVGGEDALLERCHPVLAALGQRPLHIGEVGQAAALKLAMNQLIAGLTATFALSLGLVRSEGIAVDQFMALLRDSALYAPTFDKKLAKYLEHDYGAANFPLKHLLKDIGLFEQAAARHGLDTAPMAALAEACRRAEAAGYAEQDYSAIYEALVPRRAG